MITQTKGQAFDRYTGTLLYTIKIATDTAKLIKRIRSKTLTVGDPQTKSMILERLTEYAILKARCLFDHDTRTVSFENLPKKFNGKHLSKEQWTKYKNSYEKIKIKHHALIKRLDNNRNAKVAHTQFEEQLGWDAKTAARLNHMFNLFSKNPIQAVTPENVHITPSDFPHREYMELMMELQYLLLSQHLAPIDLDKVN